MAMRRWPPDQAIVQEVEAVEMGASVLIVEDEFLVALELTELLTEAGHEVVGVIADRTSIQSIGERPQVALVDINLRDGASGPQIAEHLSHRYGTRIVYVTASHSQIGVPPPTAVGLVRKPFSETAILSAVAYAANDPETESPPPGLEPLNRG